MRGTRTRGKTVRSERKETFPGQIHLAKGVSARRTFRYPSFLLSRKVGNATVKSVKSFRGSDQPKKNPLSALIRFPCGAFKRFSKKACQIAQTECVCMQITGIPRCTLHRVCFGREEWNDKTAHEPDSFFFVPSNRTVVSAVVHTGYHLRSCIVRKRRWTSCNSNATRAIRSILLSKIAILIGRCYTMYVCTYVRKESRRCWN